MHWAVMANVLFQLPGFFFATVMNKSFYVQFGSWLTTNWPHSLHVSYQLFLTIHHSQHPSHGFKPIPVLHILPSRTRTHSDLVYANQFLFFVLFHHLFSVTVPCVTVLD